MAKRKTELRGDEEMMDIDTGGLLEVKGWQIVRSGCTDLVASSRILRRRPGPKDVCFDIKFCGVCRCDVSAIQNYEISTIYPLVPGHEVVGIVKEVGSEVTRFKVGDRVGVGTVQFFCKECDPCLDGHEIHCIQMESIYQKKGGFSSLMVSDESVVFHIPDTLKLEQAAPLLCAGITVYGPMKHHGILGKPCITLGVAGLGGLGHLAVKFGKAFGMRVLVISSSKHKKKAAFDLGADGFLHLNYPSSKEVADFIIDTVPTPHDMQPLVDLLRVNGKLIIVGREPGRLDVRTETLVDYGRSVCGSLLGGINDIAEMLEICGERGIYPDVEVIIMDYFNEAVKQLDRKQIVCRFVVDIEKSLSILSATDQSKTNPSLMGVKRI